MRTANYTAAPTSNCYATPGASTFGQIVVFGMNVSPPASNGFAPTGWVDFFDGSTKLDSSIIDSQGYAAFRTAALGVGMHTITAVYSGDANYAPSTATISITVNNNATVLYVSPSGVDTNPGTLQYPVKTLAEAYSKLTNYAGGTIYMEAGNYDPNDGAGGSGHFIDWGYTATPLGGSAGHPVTITP